MSELIVTPVDYKSVLLEINGLSRYRQQTLLTNWIPIAIKNNTTCITKNSSSLNLESKFLIKLSTQECNCDHMILDVLSYDKQNQFNEKLIKNSLKFYQIVKNQETKLIWSKLN